MRIAIVLFVLIFGIQASPLRAQTADELTGLINRLIALDSIELAKEVKFRPGLEPPLHAFDADESAMRVLKDPYEVFGRDQPGAAGWYRVSFVVPPKLGKFAIPPNGYNLGIESNVLGAWEFYAYINGKPAGLWSKDGMLANANRHATHWMSNAPMPTKAGDKITVAILAMASPLGRGSPEGTACGTCGCASRSPTPARGSLSTAASMVPAKAEACSVFARSWRHCKATN